MKLRQNTHIQEVKTLRPEIYKHINLFEIKNCYSNGRNLLLYTFIEG